MLLVIDVGNTETVLGVFGGDELRAQSSPCETFVDREASHFAEIVWKHLECGAGGNLTANLRHPKIDQIEFDVLHRPRQQVSLVGVTLQQPVNRRDVLGTRRPEQ